MPKAVNGNLLKPKMRRIRELDGLRAIAIILVLGCHYEGFSQRAWRIPELGWIGVDLFFCLSGYLITSILLGMRGRRTPYKTFYARRLTRIVPPIPSRDCAGRNLWRIQPSSRFQMASNATLLPPSLSLSTDSCGNRCVHTSSVVYTAPSATVESRPRTPSGADRCATHHLYRPLNVLVALD